MKQKSQSVQNTKIIERFLEKALVHASNEKLLPKITWQFNKGQKHQRMFDKYRKNVLEKYKKQLKFPLAFNPQEAKTQRQLFRQKVMKSINHQLPIDYIGTLKTVNKRIRTYNDLPLEQITYQTKNQFKMFKNFNKGTFNQQYSDIYDDKLEYVAKKRRVNTIGDIKKGLTQQQYQIKPHKIEIEKSDRKINSRTKTHKTIKKQMTKQTIQQPQYIDSRSNLKTLSPRMQSSSPGKLININQQTQIFNKMKQIGSYSKTMTIDQIYLTKQSITKYLKGFYQKPNRIIDFIELPVVCNFQTYEKVIKNIKLMPLKHIHFMTFMFYDHNNDGYIDQNDLLYLSQISRKCHLLQIDFNTIRKNGRKYKLQKISNYIQLYKLSQVTQTIYFKWLKQIPQINPESEIDLQMKNYMLNLKKKKSIYLDFPSFQNIFKNQRPILWYDLLWKLSGFTYQNLRYI